jgi:lipid II:glycine glycyltransferase (peptidoglycan interpeptide bridge formation enzyme)
MANCGKELRGIVPADLACCAEAHSFLQSGFWGSFKARFGWAARAFLADWEGCERPLPLLVIRRKLGPIFSFAYVPWGPELPPGFPASDPERSSALEELAAALRPLLPQSTAFVRFDPPWYTEGPASPPPQITGPRLARAAADVQPPDTVLVDLTPPEKDILMNMKPKWRYNIGLAEKRGVTVRRLDAVGLGLFYTLFQETAKRDGINIHGPEYYHTLFAHCAEYAGQELRLYLAEYEGESLGAIIVLFRGSEAVYLYGASSNHKRNLMAPYALQWQAMKDAKEAGCAEYDLFGIPPVKDPSHPMAGLYQFKTGFGGRIIHRPGSWDYAYRPLVKFLFSWAEKTRKAVWNLKKIRRGRGGAS